MGYINTLKSPPFLILKPAVDHLLCKSFSRIQTIGLHYHTEFIDPHFNRQPCISPPSQPPSPPVPPSPSPSQPRCAEAHFFAPQASRATLNAAPPTSSASRMSTAPAVSLPPDSRCLFPLVFGGQILTHMLDAAPMVPSSISNFTAICASVGQQPKCCAVPIVSADVILFTARADHYPKAWPSPALRVFGLDLVA